MFRHERYWGVLTNVIRRRDAAEISIAWSMARRLRPAHMSDAVIGPLTEILSGVNSASAEAAAVVLRNNGVMEAGHTWMGVDAGQVAVVRQGAIYCVVHGNADRTAVLTADDQRLLSLYLNIRMRAMDQSTFKIHGVAKVQGSIFSAVLSPQGWAHPLRAFVEVRNTASLRNRWWGQVIKFVVLGPLQYALLRTFPHQVLRSEMRYDRNLGDFFVLHGLEIKQAALNSNRDRPSNLQADCVVPVSCIWSRCIVVPSPVSVRYHIIFPVRREQS
jgi:hypothetical protein